MHEYLKLITLMLNYVLFFCTSFIADTHYCVVGTIHR